MCFKQLKHVLCTWETLFWNIFMVQYVKTTLTSMLKLCDYIWNLCDYMWNPWDWIWNPQDSMWNPYKYPCKTYGITCETHTNKKCKSNANTHVQVMELSESYVITWETLVIHGRPLVGNIWFIVSDLNTVSILQQLSKLMCCKLSFGVFKCSGNICDIFPTGHGDLRWVEKGWVEECASFYAKKGLEINRKIYIYFKHS